MKSTNILLTAFLKLLVFVDGKILEKLFDDIYNRYMKDASCLVLASDHGSLEMMNIKNSVLRLDTSKCPEGLDDGLVTAFLLNCEHYMIATADPFCFMKIWRKAKDMTDNRHTPVMLFMVDQQSHISHLLKHTAAIAIPDVVIAFFNQDNKTDWPVTLYTSVLDKKNGCLTNDTVVAEVDLWNLTSGFKTGFNLYPDKMSNLGGCALRLSTFTYLPYTHLDPLDGTEIRIVQEFCTIYNCNITLIANDGNLWGTIDGNGKGEVSKSDSHIGLEHWPSLWIKNSEVCLLIQLFNETFCSSRQICPRNSRQRLFGAVYSSLADLGAAAIAPWLENFRYLDYSVPYLYTTATVLVPGAKPLSGWKVPFQPFGLSMWSAFILTLGANALFIYLITVATIKFTRFGEEVIRRGQYTNIPDSILRSIGMSVLQQTSNMIAGTPIRHLITSFEFLFLILTTCYSAELSSYLTVPQFTKPINNIHELATSGMHWVADDEVWILFIKHVDEPDLQTVVKNFETMNAERLMEIAPTGKFALAIESLSSGHFTEQTHITEEVVAKSHVMEKGLFYTAIIMVLQKASPYTEKLNRLVHRLLDSGILFFWEGEVSRRFLTFRKQMALSQTSRITSNEPTTMELSHIKGVFIIYTTGIIIALTAFIWELIHSKKITRN